MKNKLALIVAVLLGLVAVFGVKKYATDMKKQVTEKNVIVEVAAAARSLPAGTKIMPDMLTPKEMPKEGITRNNILAGQVESISGQTLIQRVERGDPLLWNQFSRPVERLDDRLREGERALALRVDAVTGVAGNLTPGSHVDIIGTFREQKADGSSGRDDLVTITLLNNVTLLAVDTRTREEEFTAGAAGARARGIYTTVTLAVTPEEANMLIFAQNYGTITLALRPPAALSASAEPWEVKESNLLERISEAREARSQRTRSPIEVEER